MRIQPVILSGGSGSRLWPLSREHYPKQLLALTGARTLLQETVARLDGLADVNQPLIVCNEEHRFLVAEQCQNISVSPIAIILEPIGRNTAPALTLASIFLTQQSIDCVMLVMPADHLIQDQSAFHQAIDKAKQLALSNKLVTFGVVPTAVETGYGYIKKGQDASINAFVEKPDLTTAKKYFESGDYLWNSGMFMLMPSVWNTEIEKFSPDILKSCTSALANSQQDGLFIRAEKESFSNCKSDSIDYAVMEKTEGAAVVPLNVGWSDIGSWSSLWEVMPQDNNGNVFNGDVYCYQTSNSFIQRSQRFIATIGIKNMIVVDTADALLIADKSNAQHVKEAVNFLKKNSRQEAQLHRRVYRPWGYYESIDSGERFQVKRICVNPGAALSLQMHHRRAEHWVVVKGIAKVTRGEEILFLNENESTYIPIGMKHRLQNEGEQALEIIEVQSGDYLGEDDIVRFEDIYRREQS